MTPHERAVEVWYDTLGSTADDVVDAVLDAVGYDALKAERDWLRAAAQPFTSIYRYHGPSPDDQVQVRVTGAQMYALRAALGHAKPEPSTVRSHLGSGSAPSPEAPKREPRRGGYPATRPVESIGPPPAGPAPGGRRAAVLAERDRLRTIAEAVVDGLGNVPRERYPGIAALVDEARAALQPDPAAGDEYARSEKPLVWHSHTRNEKCPDCDGSGSDPAPEEQYEGGAPCQMCNGAGERLLRHAHVGGDKPHHDHEGRPSSDVGESEPPPWVRDGGTA